MFLRHLALAIAATLLISACGSKGGLYLPPEKTQQPSGDSSKK